MRQATELRDHTANITATLANILKMYLPNEAHGSVLGVGIMILAGRSPVRVPDEVIFFFQFT
jgi:Uma2 family endonuclease